MPHPRAAQKLHLPRDLRRNNSAFFPKRFSASSCVTPRFGKLPANFAGHSSANRVKTCKSEQLVPPWLPPPTENSHPQAPRQYRFRRAFPPLGPVFLSGACGRLVQMVQSPADAPVNRRRPPAAALMYRPQKAPKPHPAVLSSRFPHFRGHLLLLLFVIESCFDISKTSNLADAGGALR